MLLNDDIQSGKNQNNYILFKDFPLSFLLNLLVRNIKRGGFQKKNPTFAAIPFLFKYPDFNWP